MTVEQLAVVEQLTPTEQRLMAVLKDGKFHTKTELKSVLDDDLAADGALAQRLYHLKRMLVQHGLTIAFFKSHSGVDTKYQLCRNINTDE